MKKPLKIPAALSVVTLAFGGAGCGSSSPTPVDAAPQDRGFDTASVDTASGDTASGDIASVDTNPVDVCPDPSECYSSIKFDDGGVNAHVVYVRSDGGASDVPCPPVPPMCPVA